MRHGTGAAGTRSAQAVRGYAAVCGKEPATRLDPREPHPINVARMSFAAVILKNLLRRKLRSALSRIIHKGREGFWKERGMGSGGWDGVERRSWG